MSGNETAALPAWFRDPASADLALSAAAADAIEEIERDPDALDDFAGYARPAPPELTDLGAFAYPFLFANGFESGDLLPWSAAAGWPWSVALGEPTRVIRSLRRARCRPPARCGSRRSWADRR